MRGRGKSVFMGRLRSVVAGCFRPNTGICIRGRFAAHCPLKGGGDATELHCSSALAGADAVDYSYQPISTR